MRTISSWGQRHRPRPPLPGCGARHATQSCAVPGQGRRRKRKRREGGRGALRRRRAPYSSGEFRLAEGDGQLQILLLLLGEACEPCLLLPLALSLGPLDHVVLRRVLLRVHKSHVHTRTRTHTHTHGTTDKRVCRESTRHNRWTEAETCL